MIEDDLKAAFARHENQTPDVGMLRTAIDTTARQRRHRRNGMRLASLAVIAALAMLVPWAVANRAGLVSLPIGVPSVPAGPDGEVNLLLLGLDGSPPMSVRTDAIIWVHIPASRQRVYLISFERDVMVDIPGHGRDKINSIYHRGGAELTASVVEKLMGKELDGTVALNFNAAGRVVDALGGLEICLPKAVVSLHHYQVGSDVKYVNEHVAHERKLKPYVHQQGCHQYRGALAADLMRQRYGHPNGVYGRDQIIRLVLVTLAKRMASLNLLTDADKIAALLKVDGIKADTDFSLVGLAMQMQGIQPSNVVGIGSPSYTSTTDGVEQVLPPKMNEVFAALRQGTLDNWVAQPGNAGWVTRLK